MARKRYDESGENHDRWLISYADFLTLLFAFFVVMYAVSVVNAGKYRVLSEALGDAFNGDPQAQRASTPVDQLPLTNLITRKRMEAARRERDRLALLARELNSSLAPLVKNGKVSITQSGRGLSVDINASILFDEGEAGLGEDARATLGTVAGLLRNDAWAIEVEGHTDNRPIATSSYPSNWELSAVRASSVVRLFIDSGVAPQRLRAVGHGDNLPLAPNTDEAGRARNRRVAVTILASMPNEAVPKQ
jgi:chemotaxis protein MotB